MKFTSNLMKPFMTALEEHCTTVNGAFHLHLDLVTGAHVTMTLRTIGRDYVMGDEEVLGGTRTVFIPLTHVTHAWLAGTH